MIVYLVEFGAVFFLTIGAVFFLTILAWMLLGLRRERRYRRVLRETEEALRESGLLQVPRRW